MINDDCSSSTDDEGASEPKVPQNYKLSSFNETTDKSLSFSTLSSSSKTMTTTTASALLTAASHKAGMQDSNRHLIDQIILRESGNSSYMQKQRQRDEATNLRIAQMKQKLAAKDKSSSCQGTPWRREVESRVLQPRLERIICSRREAMTSSTCVVLDMDSFYISCELLSRPELASVPCCVGGSMILTSNYTARKYGVRSAMAGYIGDKLVEELSGGKETLVHLPSNFELYRKMSGIVRDVLVEYDPTGMKAYSLDEVYLNLGPYLNLRLGKGLDHDQVCNILKGGGGGAQKVFRDDDGDHDHDHDHDSMNSNAVNTQGSKTSNCLDRESLDTREKIEEHVSFPYLLNIPKSKILAAASTIVAEMRKKVTEATGGLTCSAGLASNFMLAKIASDHNKPNGQLAVGPSHNEILHFIHGLQVRKIPGIGRVTEKMLNAFGINTVQKLYEQRAVVNFLFQPATSNFLFNASVGYSTSEIADYGEGEVSDEGAMRKGISRERTFRPGSIWSEINVKLEEITRKLSNDMKEKDIKARTITLKVKLHTFDVMSKSRSMPKGVYVQESEDMLPVVFQMLIDLKRQHLKNVSGDGGNSSSHEKVQFSVRLLGVRCSNFMGEEEKADNISQKGIEQFLISKKISSGNRNGSYECNDDFSSPETERARHKCSDLQSVQNAGNRSFHKSRPSKSNKKVLSQYFNSPSVLKQKFETDSKAFTPREYEYPKRKESIVNSKRTNESNDVGSKEETIIQCPICSMKFSKVDNNYINGHIDSCLNTSAVREILQQQQVNGVGERLQKKARMTDYFRTGLT